LINLKYTGQNKGNNMIPDLLNMLFDQSDYPTLLMLCSLNNKYTRYANKYSIANHYHIPEKQSLNGACRHCKLKIIEHTLTKIDCTFLNNMLITCSVHNNIHAAKYLINNGANVHVQNDASLRKAAMHGHLDTVIFLVNRGANINAFNNDALSQSIAYGHKHVEKYLMSIDKENPCDDNMIT